MFLGVLVASSVLVAADGANFDVIRGLLVHEEHIAPTQRTLAKFVDELLAAKLHRVKQQGIYRYNSPKPQYQSPPLRPTYPSTPSYSPPPTSPPPEPIKPTYYVPLPHTPPPTQTYYNPPPPKPSYYTPPPPSTEPTTSAKPTHDSPPPPPEETERPYYSPPEPAKPAYYSPPPPPSEPERSSYYSPPPPPPEPERPNHYSPPQPPPEPPVRPTYRPEPAKPTYFSPPPKRPEPPAPRRPQFYPPPSSTPSTEMEPPHLPTFEEEEEIRRPEKPQLALTTTSYGAPPTHKPVITYKSRPRSNSQRGSKSVDTKSKVEGAFSKTPSREEYKRLIKFFLTAFDSRY
ncbi:uncharacterized protein LOC132202519 [Neocloeon triangulifer]|uniref:uncharacterized protein LOC132202519 n=1 Tax=Neocloeon triangulifer TaxID=2078957 RepID=UPI00286F9569|nr:uncharacterized protein LOC132202519 [Neocloeon triangulifer]